MEPVALESTILRTDPATVCAVEATDGGAGDFVEEGIRGGFGLPRALVTGAAGCVDSREATDPPSFIGAREKMLSGTSRSCNSLAIVDGLMRLKTSSRRFATAAEVGDGGSFLAEAPVSIEDLTCEYFEPCEDDRKEELLLDAGVPEFDLRIDIATNE